MRKICLLGFSFLIFLLSFNLLFVKAYAAVKNSSVSSIAKSENNVNYELPYPGLLPDNPLYLLRVVRDKTVGFLISDPLKKTEFDLLQANKRLNAGIFLFNKGKTSLALSTVSKAENYFTQALDQIEEAKRQGRNASEMEKNLRNALGKHQQELGYLISKAKVDVKAGFENEQKRLVGFEERLNH